MKASIFEYTDYKKFLIDLIDSQPAGGRGERSKLADFVGCQNTFISHVFGGDYHFSPEQAERTAKYFRFTVDETDYFMLLVSHNRAGTPELKALYQRQLTKLKDKNLVLKKRLNIDETFSVENQARYYSDWIYAAVQSTIVLPNVRTVDAIAQKLMVTPGRVAEVLEFLQKAGTVKRQGATFVPTQQFFHLDKTSPLIAQHHRNWRLKTMTQADFSAADRLHYSTAITCSREAYEKVQLRLTQALEDSIEIVKPTKDEELVVFCIDWYRV